MTKQISNTRRGSTLVESALVLSIFILTLIGIVDVGQVLVLQQGLVERVRAGARYAAVNPYNASSIGNVVLYNAPDAPENSTPLLNLAANMIMVELINAGTPEERVEIRIVNYPLRLFTPLAQGLYNARPIMISIPAEGFTEPRTVREGLAVSEVH